MPGDFSIASGFPAIAPLPLSTSPSFVVIYFLSLEEISVLYAQYQDKIKFHHERT
jgi:hypothetical protein